MMFLDRAAQEASTIVKARRVVTLRADWETQDKLRQWAQQQGFDLGWSYSGWPQHSSNFDFHVTIVASANKVAIDDGVRMIDPITVTPVGYEVMGKGTPTIRVEADTKMRAIREFFVSTFAIDPTYADWKPHISLSYKWDGQPDIVKITPALPDFPLRFDLLMVAQIDEPASSTKDAAPVKGKMFTTADAAKISGTRRTNDGYLVTEARVARGGNIQDYYGHEIGEGQPNQVFKVYRPADEIFRADSLATFAHKPVTMGHPQIEVTPETWRKDAVGHVGSEVVRDGEYVRVPLVVMDGGAISDIEAGTREISMGYDCELVMQPGTTPDGKAYDAFQRNIRINHCAIVPAGRAGPQCRIGDSAKRSTDNREGSSMKTVTIDGKAYEVADNVHALVTDGKIGEALAESNKALTDATKALSSANARADVAERENADLKTKLDAAEKGKPTADQIAAMAAELTDVIATAAKITPKVETKGKTADAIKREVVETAIGDAAKGKDAAYISAAYDMLATKDGKSDPVADAIAKGASNTNDAVKKASDARDTYLKNIENAWAAR